MPLNGPTDQEILLDENLQQKFLEILKANGIEDTVESITMKEPVALKGQHMASSSVYVQIKFQDVSIKPKNLFVKKFDTSEDGAGQSAMLSGTGMMEKEAEFFTKLLPEAGNFCKKFPGCENYLKCFPKCYYADETMLVLENLVLNDSFVMFPKEDFQDLETTKFVLTNLAQFHAITSAILEEIGKDGFVLKYQQVSKDAMLGVMRDIIVKMLNDSMDTTVAILKANPIEGSDYALNKLSQYFGKGSEIFEKCLLTYPEEKGKFLCLNLGDCWNNNMLFKLDPQTGKIIDQKFVDFQITRLGSPCYDLVYYIYLSVKNETRRKHLPELLRHYFDNFKAVRESLNKPCPFTFEEMVEDFKRRNAWGLFFSLSVACTMEAMNYVDKTEIGDNPKDLATLFGQALNKWTEKNPEKAKAIVQDSITSIQEEFSHIF